MSVTKADFRRSNQIGMVKVEDTIYSADSNSEYLLVSNDGSKYLQYLHIIRIVAIHIALNWYLLGNVYVEIPCFNIKRVSSLHLAE